MNCCPEPKLDNGVELQDEEESDWGGRVVDLGAAWSVSVETDGNTGLLDGVAGGGVGGEEAGVPAGWEIGDGGIKSWSGAGPGAGAGRAVGGVCGSASGIKGAGGADSEFPADEVPVPEWAAGIACASSCGFRDDALSATGPDPDAGAEAVRSDATRPEEVALNAVVTGPAAGDPFFHDGGVITSESSSLFPVNRWPSSANRRRMLGRADGASGEDAESLAANPVCPWPVVLDASAGAVGASALGRRQNASRAMGRSSAPDP
jgi:hypothetical protein